VQEIAKRVFETTELDKSINPDEVVAVGAAIQGGVLQGDVKDVLLLDVTPLSLGVETLGGVMTVLIPRNTTIPTSKKETFSTAADNQTSVEIKVYQGERQLAGDNRLLGRFELTGIPPSPRGVPQIEVEFNIDANGILNVKATDKASGKSTHIEIKGSSGLSQDEIEKMKRDAEANAEADKNRKELIDAKNKGDSVLYQTRKALEEHGGKVSSEVRGNIESALNALEGALKGDDKKVIEHAIAEVEKASMELGKVMYEQAKSQTTGSSGDAEAKPSGGASGKDDDVIDAEYEVKD
jgi:molecular chaperone DnaK